MNTLECKLGPVPSNILKLTERFLSVSSFKAFGDGNVGAPLSVNIGKQNVLKVKFRLQHHEVLHLSQVDFRLNGKSILAGSPFENDVQVLSSSTYGDNQQYAASNLLRSSGIFHSKGEIEPWVEFEFSETVLLDEIVIHNFNPSYHYRAFSIAIFVAGESGEYLCVHDNWKFRKGLYQIVDSIDGSVCTPLDRYISKLLVFASSCDLKGIEATLRNMRESCGEDSLITAYEVINKALSFSGYAFNQHGIVRPFGKKSHNECLQVSNDLYDFISLIKREVGYDLFLTSGTLLGAYRDGGFIDHDDDIDLCFLANESEIGRVVAEKGRFILSLNQLGIRARDSGHAQIQCELACGVSVDIFPSWREGAEVAISPLPRGMINKCDVLPLGQLELFGNQFPVPKNIEKVLVNNYGENWEVPDISWRFDWDRANIEYREFIGSK